MIFAKIPTKQRHLFIAGLILLSSAVLILTRLDNAALWDDESHTAFVGRNVARTGHPYTWDGRNMYAIRNGLAVGSDFQDFHLVTDFWVEAASFKLLGYSNWSARIPFALAAILSLILFAVILRWDFGTETSIWLYGFASLGLSVTFLLYARQGRYYASSILFALWLYASQRKCIERGDSSDFAQWAIAGMLLFYTNSMQCAAFLAALATLYFISNERVAKRNLHKAYLALGSLFLAILPYVLAYRRWNFMALIPKQPWYVRKPILIWWNLRDFDLVANLPWMSLIVLLYFLFSSRSRKSDWAPVVSNRVFQWLFLAFANAIFVACLSIQDIQYTQIADLRYLILSMPFAAGAFGALCWRLGQLSKPVGVLILAVDLLCNVFTVLPTNISGQEARGFRWLLPAYIEEISNPYPTSTEAVTDFLKKHLQQNETVFAWPEYFNYPLIFYLEKTTFCCTLTRGGPLDLVAPSLKAPLYREDNFPDWFVAYGASPSALQLLSYFSRLHRQNGKMVEFSYTPTALLDVFAYQTQRPELPWHNFGPVTRFDPNRDGVYIFKRESRVAPRR